LGGTSIVAISSAYASGTVSSVSGTTFTATGSVFVAGDVGRLIVITSGAGKLQHRKITGYTSGTVVTVDHAWDATPWLDTVSDVAPSNGDSFVVSYVQSDATFTGEAGVTVSGEQIDISALDISNGAYFHIINAQVDLDSDGIEINNGAGLVFGWYKYIANEDAQVRDSCHIVDRTSATTGGTQMAPSDGSFGMLDVYGGAIVRDNGSINFWRCYHNADSSACQVRWINVRCFGNAGLGSRTDGDRSILMLEQVGARTTLGVSNPRGAVSRVEISAIDCDQAGYVWLDVTNGGPSGRLVFTRLNNILDKVIRCSTGGHSGTNVMEVIGKKSEIDAAPTFIEASGTPSGTHIFRYGNLIKPSFFDENADILNYDSIKTFLKDVNGTTTNTVTVTDGMYPEHFDRHTDILTTTGDKNISDGTLYAPYKLNCILFDKVIISQTISLTDTFDSQITMLPDTVLMETTKATVDAYTEINTPEKWYDRAKSYLYDNYAGETETIVTRNGNVINAGSYNVTIDATAVSAFAFDGSTITIKASTFTGNINTSGIFTLYDAVLEGVVNGQLEVTDGATYTEDIAGKFVVDTGTVTSFTISGFIPTEIEHIGSGSATILGIYNAKLVGTTINGVLANGEYVDGSSTLILGDGLNPSGNWVVASDTITLANSTTEASLLGLRGLADVNYSRVGDYYSYEIVSKKIQIDGTLNINPATEGLVFTGTAQWPVFSMGASGDCTVGTQGGTLGIISENVWLNSTHQSDNRFNDDTNASLRIDQGSFTQNEGKIQVASPPFFGNGAVINFCIVTTTPTQDGNDAWVYVADATINSIEILSTDGIKYVVTNSAPSVENNIILRGNAGYETILNANQNTSNLNSSGSLRKRAYPTLWDITNLEDAESKNITIGQTTTAYADVCVVAVSRLCSFEVRDFEDAVISGAKLYISDDDSGSRPVGVGLISDLNALLPVDISSDLVYEEATDGSGLITDLKVYNRFVYLDGPTPNTIFQDYRWTNATTVPVFFVSYEQVITTLNISVNGATSLTTDVTMLPDILITEATRATVDAYASIDTSEKFYDRAKSYLVTNYSGETTTIVSRMADVINAGSYNVIIDADAAQAFAFDESTITIKASIFIGNITTTGTISLLNGAFVDGSYTDSTGTTTIVGVDVTVTDQSSNPIENANCIIIDQNPTSITSITRVGSTATVTSTNHNLVVGDEVNIIGANESEYNKIQTVTNIIDSNTFEYTVSGTPTTPATGTITFKKLFINGLTNASGVVSKNNNFFSNTPVNVVIRKGTSAPYYKPLSQGSTVTSNGLSLVIKMINDS
jgi:hypothetical protein